MRTDPILTQPTAAIRDSALATNKVLRNTYLLLSATLAFSALTAGVALALGLPHPGLLLTLIGYFGLLWGVHKTADRALGLVFVFALTGSWAHARRSSACTSKRFERSGVVLNAFGITARPSSRSRLRHERPPLRVPQRLLFVGI